MDIRKLNNKKYSVEWDELQYDFWDVFEDHRSLTNCEILLAKEFLKTMKIEIDDEHIITFKAAPVHIANLAVNFIRRLQSEYPKNFPKNFCDGIEDDI